MRDYDDASNVLTSSSGAVSKTSGNLDELKERAYSRFDEVGRAYLEVYDAELSTDERAGLDPGTTPNARYAVLFDPGSRAIQTTDANGNAFKESFDAVDRLVLRTDPLGNAVTRDYDRNSNIVAMTERESPGPGASGVGGGVSCSTHSSAEDVH